MPTFMPETSWKYLIFLSSQWYQTNRAFPCQTEPQSHRVQEIPAILRLHNPGIQAVAWQAMHSVFRFLEATRFLIS